MTNGNGISLREFFERLLNDHALAHREHQAAHDREHQASQKAIDTAATLAKENKSDSNEWRAAMTDRERSFARVEALEDVVRRLRILEAAPVSPVVVETLRERVITLEKVNAQTQGALNVARFLGAGAMAVSGSLLVWLITRGGV